MNDSLVAAEATPVPTKGKWGHKFLGRWGKVFVRFLSVQLLVQAMTLAVGIFLVRTLGKTEYAFYTIATAMQGTLSVLSETGVSSALSSTGGRVWQDKKRFGELIQTGLYVRRQLGLIAAIAVGPLLTWMLISHGSHAFYAIAITLVVIVGVNFQLTAGVLAVVPRMCAHINRLQKIDFICAALRLVLTSAVCLIFVNAPIAVLIATLSFGVQTYLLRKCANEGADLHASVNEVDRIAIYKIVLQQLPVSIYFCIQGQLTIFLISLFGTTSNIAEVGALARLSIIFTLIYSLLQNIILPKFAKSQIRDEVITLYFQILGGLSLILVPLVLLTILFREQVLWLLGGDKYGHLAHEIVIVMIGAAVGCLVQAMSMLNRARAWVSHPWLYILSSLGWSALLLVWLDMSKTHDAVVFGALSFLPGLLVSMARTSLGFRSLQDSKIV